MTKSINQNVVFGVLKSTISYLFILCFYQVADQETITVYVNYEIIVAIALLMTFGIQSRSYRELDQSGLNTLSMLFWMLFFLAVIAEFSLGWRRIAFLLPVAALDKMAEIQLQGIRQRGAFVFYNLADTLNMLSTRAGFLFMSTGYDVWIPILLTKLTFSTAWLVYGWSRSGFLFSWFFNPMDLFKNKKEWSHYCIFDVMNYSSGHLDLLILTTFVPSIFLTSYFFVRKFYRLPLILLNYVIDPAYISISALNSQAEQKIRVNCLLHYSYWLSLLAALLFTVFFIFTGSSIVIITISLVMMVTCQYNILTLYAGLYTLLFASQSTRTYVRVIVAAATAVSLCLPFFGVQWIEALALAPLVAWFAVALFIFQFSSRTHYFQIFLHASLVLMVVFFSPGYLEAQSWFGPITYLLTITVFLLTGFIALFNKGRPGELLALIDFSNLRYQQFDLRSFFAH